MFNVLQNKYHNIFKSSERKRYYDDLNFRESKRNVLFVQFIQNILLYHIEIVGTVLFLEILFDNKHPDHQNTHISELCLISGQNRVTRIEFSTSVSSGVFGGEMTSY